MKSARIKLKQERTHAKMADPGMRAKRANLSRTTRSRLSRVLSSTSDLVLLNTKGSLEDHQVEQKSHAELRKDARTFFPLFTAVVDVDVVD